jgi:hypothetical protein
MLTVTVYALNKEGHRLLPNMRYPRRPSQYHPSLAWLALVLNIEQEVNEDIGVVHPADLQHDAAMVGVQAQGLSLNDRRDENGKSKYKVGCRLDLG